MYTFISVQKLKVSPFYAPKIIKIGGRTTKLQSFKKWRVFLWATAYSIERIHSIMSYDRSCVCNDDDARRGAGASEITQSESCMMTRSQRNDKSSLRLWRCRVVMQCLSQLGKHRFTSACRCMACRAYVSGQVRQISTCKDFCVSSEKPCDIRLLSK